jgi:hypothetical protein
MTRATTIVPGFTRKQRPIAWGTPLNWSLDPDIVGSVHLHAGGLDDRTVSFEVLMNTSFEFVEGRDVGLARAGLGQLVREILAREDRTHLVAQLVDDILRHAGGTE